MSNEQAPECCPFCGAARKAGCGFAWFECGTMTAPEDNNRRDQTPACATAERERLTRERDEARERMAIAIADRDSARARAEQVWKLREEFVALLGTDDIQKGVETVSGLLARVKRLEEAGDAMERHIDNGLCLHGVTVDWNAAKEATP